MRYLQAAGQKLVALEPDHDVIRNLVEQAGFECAIDDSERKAIEARWANAVSKA